MSHRRETVDGTISGGSSGAEERRNTISNKGKISKSLAAKRSGRNLSSLSTDFELFGHSEGDSDRYIITYADLITLLLGLFILLYASSNVDIQKYRKMMEVAGSYFGGGNNPTSNVSSGTESGNGTGIVPEADPFAPLRSELNTVIQDETLRNSIKLIQNERGVTIRILDDILFKSGSAELTDYSKIILEKLAKVINAVPNDIRIEGHTDNVPVNGIFPSNWHLSVARATNAAYFLMNEGGVEPGRVGVVGYSEYQPVSSNESPEGRANNRRVDIIILNK